MIRPVHARNGDSPKSPQVGCAGAGPSVFGDYYPNPQKRKLGRPRNGSCKEHPIEVDDEKKYRKAAVGEKKKSGGSKHPFPAAAALQSGGNSGRSFQVQRSRNTNPHPFTNPHPLWGSGGGNRLLQRPQTVIRTAGAHYPQSPQPQISTQSQLQLSQIPPMKPPATFRPFFISGSSPAAIAQQCSKNISQGANIHFQRGAQYAPNNLGVAVPGPSRPYQNYYFQETPGATNAHYQPFEPGANSNELPPTGMNSGGCLAPPSGTDWLFDSEAEQKIINRWLEDWESEGLLNDTIEGPLFKS